MVPVVGLDYARGGLASSRRDLGWACWGSWPPHLRVTETGKPLARSYSLWLPTLGWNAAELLGSLPQPSQVFAELCQVCDRWGEGAHSLLLTPKAEQENQCKANWWSTDQRSQLSAFKSCTRGGRGSDSVSCEDRITYHIASYITVPHHW